MMKYILLLSALFLCTGCPSQQSSGSPSSVAAQRPAALSLHAATVAVLMLDELEAEHAKTLNSTMTAELAAAEGRVARLERAAASLRIADDWLRGAVSAEDGRAALKSAIQLLRLAVQELQAQGKSIPPELDAMLGTAEQVL